MNKLGVDSSFGVQKIYDYGPTNSLPKCPPSVILHQAIQCQLQCCNGIQLSDPYKPMNLAQTSVIPIYTERHLMLISSP